MIAYVGPDLPHDLLMATGDCAGPLSWHVDRPMPAADRWLESKFPLWTRSILQDWSDGRLDEHDAVIFSRADDAAQRLYYYICELRRQAQLQGPEPLIFDAAAIGRSSSAHHMGTAVRALAQRLGVSADALQAGIRQTNARRAGRTEPPQGAGQRCLIAGTPPPDRRIHEMIERAGWTALGPTLADSWQDLGNPVAPESDDPFMAVAHQLRASSQSSRSFFDRAAALTADAQDRGASAVLLWFAEEDEARIWHLPAQRDAVAQAGIPTLVLTRRDWRANDGVEREIVPFLQELGA